MRATASFTKVARAISRRTFATAAHETKHGATDAHMVFAKIVGVGTVVIGVAGYFYEMNGRLSARMDGLEKSIIKEVDAKVAGVKETVTKEVDAKVAGMETVVASEVAGVKEGISDKAKAAALIVLRDYGVSG